MDARVRFGFLPARSLGAALAVLVALLVVAPVDAAHGWCRADPAGTLDGHGWQMFLASPVEYWSQNDSSGDILIEHPKDVATRKVWEDPNGYFGQGVSTNFATNETLRKFPDSMEVVVKVRIPASTDTMPIQVEWAPGPLVFGPDGTPLYNPVLASVVGFSNEWIVLRTILPYA